MKQMTDHPNRTRIVMTAAIIGLSVFLFAIQPVAAKTFAVNSVADLPDYFPGDGVCAAQIFIGDRAIDRCTLRAAVMEANAFPGADVITLRAATYRLDYTGDNYPIDETDGRVGDLDIKDKLTITGAGKTATVIDAENLGQRIFDIHDGSVVTIEKLTLKNGTALGDQYFGPGGDEQNYPFEWKCPIREPKDKADGGGILNRGAIVFVTQVRFEHNLAICDGGGADNILDGVLWVKECDFIENVAIANGGGVENDDDSILAVLPGDDGQKSGFYWNNAYENGGALANDDGLVMVNQAVFMMNAAQHYGGGIWNGDSDAMMLKDVTIMFNDVRSAFDSDGGGIFNNDGFLLLMGQNTIRWNSPNDIVDWNEPEGLPGK